MKKRDFMKLCCGAGLCSCVPVSLIATQDDKPKDEKKELDELRDQNWRLQWRINHAKSQLAIMLKCIESELDETTRRDILNKMGRNCAKSLGWAEKYKGNPEGFFEHMHNHSGETLSFDADRKMITIITRERDCDCPLVDSTKTPAYYCNCSLGWQEETYEIILGKKVQAELKESVLRGSKRCVFEVRIV